MDIVYVWTRRLGIALAIVGAWEVLQWVVAWSGSVGPPPQVRELLRWGGQFGLGLLIWYRLRRYQKVDPYELKLDGC